MPGKFNPPPPPSFPPGPTPPSRMGRKKIKGIINYKKNGNIYRY